MRDFLKRAWIRAGMLINTAMSIIAALLFSSHKVSKELKIIARNIDPSRKAFILGCGPSLKEVLSAPKLFRELQENDTIATNRFAINDSFFKLRPKYYILLDPKFYSEEFIKSDQSVLEMYDAMNRIDWPMILFLSNETNMDVVKRYLTNENVSICRFNGTTVIGPVKVQNWMYSKNLGIPTSRNVIIPALKLMINLGYKNIYLYGSEFSWTKNFDVDPRNNRVYENSRHFYNDSNIQYFEKGEYREYLRRIDLMLYGTEQIAKYAESVGVKVVNRTKGSFIDAFEYENPDRIMS